MAVLWSAIQSRTSCGHAAFVMESRVRGYEKLNVLWHSLGIRYRVSNSGMATLPLLVEPRFSPRLNGGLNTLPFL